MIYIYIYIFFFFSPPLLPTPDFPFQCRGFVISFDHTERHTTVGRTPLDEGSARRTDLYLTTHNTHNKQTSMPPVGFEPTIPVSERPQTHALDRAATAIVLNDIKPRKFRMLA
jgi:hypothetical protein